MQPTHVVLRPLDAGGKRYPGELVDASAWRHTEYFVEKRTIRPLFAGEEGVACGCGRLWATQEHAISHCRSQIDLKVDQKASGKVKAATK